MISRIPPRLVEGRIAFVTKREAGGGGRGGADRRAAHVAYGQIVWSWRAYAGAKSVMMLRITRVTVANAGSPSSAL